jgi:hypothetical protein
MKTESTDHHHRFREATKETYKFTQWPMGKSAFAVSKESAMDQNATVGGFTQYRRSEVPLTNAHIDHFRHADPDVQATATVSEYSSPQAAQEALIDRLSECMAMQLPNGEEKGLHIGDVCFIGHGDPVDEIFFVRRNLLVHVQSIGQKTVSVVDLAKNIDRKITHSTT